MRDTELYRHLLGIEPPWTVARVELNQADQRVDVWVAHDDGVKWPCPECGRALPVYDHAEERGWRHLDSCQFMTYLHARPPRVECPEHGVRQARLPWAEPRSRFTALFERLAIDVLLETNVEGATRILRISWDEAWHLMERAVARGQAEKQRRPISQLGVDEKAIAKGHRYMTLVCDLQMGTVEYVTEDRKESSLNGYFETLEPKQRSAIEAVAIDMWEPYVMSIRRHVPNASDKIVYDRFHIMRHMTQAVDSVRKREHRALRSDGDDRLTGSKYLWLYSHENLPDQHADRFDDLRRSELKTARAWALKESLRHLWSYRRRGWAERFWRQWYFWATHSRLAPVIKVAKMLRGRLKNVLTYFQHPITNAVSEGLNSKIQTVKQMARGFRNPEHFKTAIYFRCGGLALYPYALTHSIPG
jgi:transposase